VLVIEEDQMNQGVVNTVSRRAALPVLGVAGLAGALLSPFETQAKKKHKKNNRKKEDPENPEDPNALCNQQVAQCTTFFNPACKGDLACLEKVNRCCPPLGTCQFATAFSCLAAP